LSRKNHRLSDLKKLSERLVKRFDKLTGEEKRRLVSKIVRKITIKQDNEIELHLAAFNDYDFENEAKKILIHLLPHRVAEEKKVRIRI
jgi:hypothetical protein